MVKDHLSNSFNFVSHKQKKLSLLGLMGGNQVSKDKSKHKATKVRDQVVDLKVVKLLRSLTQTSMKKSWIVKMHGSSISIPHL